MWDAGRACAGSRLRRRAGPAGRRCRSRASGRAPTWPPGSPAPAPLRTSARPRRHPQTGRPPGAARAGGRRRGLAPAYCRERWIMAVVAGAFKGWTGDFQGYFLGLQLNNSKAYFDAHRKQYEEEVKAPMLALLADLESEFGAARLSRPNRDIRFSADKSPYKTNIYASTSAGGYVAPDAEGLVAGGGRYMMEPSELASYREAVAAKASGEKIAAIVAALRSKGYGVE